MRNRRWVLRFRNSGYCMRYDTSCGRKIDRRGLLAATAVFERKHARGPHRISAPLQHVWETTEAGETRLRSRVAGNRRSKLTHRGDRIFSRYFQGSMVKTL